MTTARAPKAARMWRRAVWHLVCAALLALLLYPVLWLISMSFKPAEEIVSSLALLPKKLVLGNYTQALEGSGGVSVWTFFGNSLTVALLCVLGNVISCALAAYAFARMRFRLRGPLFAFMIGTLMLPAHVVLIPQYTIFNNMGLVNTFVPLVLPKFLATDAFFVFLMVQFMRGIPYQLDEAAKIDGATPLQIFWHIIVPLSRPALVTTAIFSFIWTWNDFFRQLVFLSDLEDYTVPVALTLFIDSTSESAVGPMFAMSLLSLVPVFLFFLAFQRMLVEGINTSGLKG
jgi:multiple sugar transport system permease protein